MNSGDIVGKDRGEDIRDTGRCPTATCGLHVYVPDDQYQLLRQTGQSFYCAAGHRQSFTAMPELDAQARRLREAEKTATEAARRQALAEASAQRLACTCPWPTCDGRVLASPRGLRQHMVRAHGAPWSSPELDIEQVGRVLNGADPLEVIG